MYRKTASAVRFHFSMQPRAVSAQETTNFLVRFIGLVAANLFPCIYSVPLVNAIPRNSGTREQEQFDFESFGSDAVEINRNNSKFNNGRARGSKV